MMAIAVRTQARNVRSFAAWSLYRSIIGRGSQCIGWRSQLVLAAPPSAPSAPGCFGVQLPLNELDHDPFRAADEGQA